MSTPATRLYGIDIANLNGLVIDIRERLSGGLTGDFYEKGGVIKEGVRHAQLPILFGAMAQVDTLVSALEKQAVIAEAEEPKDAQKSGGKLNKNMMATIKEMVHAEVEMRTRTISIENERMKAVVQKLEVQNAKLVDEVASVKSKQKKSGGQPASGSDEKYHALGKKLEGLQKIQKQNEAGQSALARKLDAMQAEFLRFGSTAFKAAEVVAKIEGLSEQMKDAISDLRVCESDLWKVERDLRACEGNALENGKKCDSNAKIFELRHVELVGAAIEVQQRLGLPVQARHVAVSCQMSEYLPTVLTRHVG